MIGVFYAPGTLTVINRGMLSGIRIRAPITGGVLSEDDLTFHETTFNQDVVLAFLGRFGKPESNTYTVDHIIDADNSYFYLAGVPQVAGIIVRLGHFLNEGENSLIIDISLSPIDGTFFPLERP